MFIREDLDGTVCFTASQPGIAPEPAGKRWAKLPRELARDGTESWDWTAGAIVDNLPVIEARLIATVKVAAETRKMLVATTGGWKKTEYAAKRNEVIAWDALGTTAALILAAFNALAPAVKSLRFEYAVADAAQFGDTPADAIARFRAALARSTSTSAVSAIEAKTCAAIRTATTSATKRAAYAAGGWG